MLKIWVENFYFTLLFWYLPIPNDAIESNDVVPPLKGKRNRAVRNSTLRSSDIGSWPPNSKNQTVREILPPTVILLSAPTQTHSNALSPSLPPSHLFIISSSIGQIFLIPHPPLNPHIPNKFSKSRRRPNDRSRTQRAGPHGHGDHRRWDVRVLGSTLLRLHKGRERRR